jgi:hypothetical protein
MALPVSNNNFVRTQFPLHKSQAFHPFQTSLVYAEHDIVNPGLSSNKWMNQPASLKRANFSPDSIGVAPLKNGFNFAFLSPLKITLRVPHQLF